MLIRLFNFVHILVLVLILIAVIEVSVTENIQVSSWKTSLESRLATLCRKAFLRLLLETRNSRRQKRLATDGDVKVQVRIFHLCQKLMLMFNL